MPQGSQTTSSSAAPDFLREARAKSISQQVSLWTTLFFWGIGLGFAVLQAWSFRFTTTVDGIAYLDMSDAMFRGFGWDHVINGVWSPLYAVALGMGRHLTPAGEEIQNAHYVNIAIFVFAFLCFEALRRTIKRCTFEMNAAPAWSAWAFDVIAYSLFLWASIFAITLETVRPDMLMSAFLYLAAAIVVSIRGRGATSTKYILLGAILGIAYLAKAPMLYIGLVMLGCTLNVRRLRETMVRATVGAGILLAVGSLYFIPLSVEAGHFTFGEAAEYNYLGHVDQIGMYQETIGHAAGKLQHAPPMLIDHPPVYAFDTGEHVTFPLRFQPARWTAGARPQFYLPSQLAIIRENAVIYRTLLFSLSAVIVGALLFAYHSPSGARSIFTNWPVTLIGIAGLGMYVLVHVEERYVGGFFLLACLGIISGACAKTRIHGRLLTAFAAVVALSLLIQVAAGVRRDYRRYRQYPTNAWLLAAHDLSGRGVHSGDKVARITDRFADLNWARELRATVVCEVRFDHANEFWSAGPDLQDRVLRAMADSGAKYVVANHRDAGRLPESWRRLGGTTYYYRELAGFRSQ